MKTESNPTCSASTEKSSSARGANCSADALYPSFSTRKPPPYAQRQRVYRLPRQLQPSGRRPAKMQLGVSLPLVDIGGDPSTVKDFAQLAEAEGYDHVMLADHVLGVNAAARP